MEVIFHMNQYQAILAGEHLRGALDCFAHCTSDQAKLPLLCCSVMSSCIVALCFHLHSGPEQQYFRAYDKDYCHMAVCEDWQSRGRHVSSWQGVTQGAVFLQWWCHVIQDHYVSVCVMMVKTRSFLTSGSCCIKCGNILPVLHNTGKRHKYRLQHLFQDLAWTKAMCKCGKVSTINFQHVLALTQEGTPV